MTAPFDSLEALKSFLRSKGITRLDNVAEPEFKGVTAHVDAFGSTVHFIFHDSFSKKMKNYIPNLVRISTDGKLYIYRENDETIYRKFDVASSSSLAQFVAKFAYEGGRLSGYMSALYNLEDLSARYYVQYTEIAESMTSSLAGKFTASPREEIEEFVHVIIDRIMFLAFLENVHGFPQELLSFDLSSPENYYETVLVPVIFWLREPHAIGTNLLVNGKDYKGLFKIVPFLNKNLFREVTFEIAHVKPWIQYNAAKGDLSIHLPAEILSKQDMAMLFKLIGKNPGPSTPRVALVAGENSTGEGINPEILGYIFEQGLDQNAFGAFYTPRGVTSRMVKTSLMNWLWQWLPAEVQGKLVQLARAARQQLPHDYPRDSDLQAACAEKLEYAIYNQEEVPNDLVDAVKHVVMEKIKDIKVIDSSCGSGAFLLAMFNELLVLYKKCSPSVPNKKAIYDQAISIIKNNLFGVDIMAEATEKTILRLWLAVAEQCPDIKELEPFPDLDLKFFKGNAIIGYVNLSSAQQTLAAFTPVHDLQSQFTHDLTKKTFIDEIIRNHNAIFEDAICQIVIAKKQAAFESIKQAFIDMGQASEKVAVKRILSKIRGDPDEEIQQLLTPAEMDLVFESIKIPFKFSDPYAHLPPAEKKQMLNIKYRNHAVDPVILRCFEWMDPFHWAFFFQANVFPAAKFDILIGNPPYEGARKESTREAAMTIWNRLQRVFIIGLQDQGVYKLITGAWDLCLPFVERAFDLVNERGVISLLLPKSFGTTEYTSMLRDHISNKHLMIQIIKIDPRVSLFHRIDKASGRMVQVGIQNIIFTMRNRPFRDKRHAIVEYLTRELDDRARNTPEVRTGYELRCHPFAKENFEGIPLKFLCCIVKGMQATAKADDARLRRTFNRDDIVSSARDGIHAMPLYSTEHVAPFNVVGSAWLEWGTSRVPAQLHRKRHDAFFKGELLITPRSAKKAPFALVNGNEREFRIEDYLIMFKRWSEWHFESNPSLIDDNSIRRTIMEVFKGEKIAEKYAAVKNISILSQYITTKALMGILTCNVVVQHISYMRKSYGKFEAGQWREIKIPFFYKHEIDEIDGNIGAIIDATDEIRQALQAEGVTDANILKFIENAWKESANPPEPPDDKNKARLNDISVLSRNPSHYDGLARIDRKFHELIWGTSGRTPSLNERMESINETVIEALGRSEAAIFWEVAKCLNHCAENGFERFFTLKNGDAGTIKKCLENFKNDLPGLKKHRDHEKLCSNKGSIEAIESLILTIREKKPLKEFPGIFVAFIDWLDAPV